jgi:hypothetical protein
MADNDQDAQIWRSLEEIRPDDRRSRIETFRIQVAGRHKVLDEILADAEGAWSLGCAVCTLIEAKQGRDAQREKASADLNRRLEARVGQLNEDLERAVQIDRLYRGALLRVPTNLADDAPFLSEETSRALAVALEATKAALTAAQAHYTSRASLSLPEPEQEFAKALAILFVTQGHKTQGGQVRDRFKEAMRLSFDACEVTLSVSAFQSAYMTGHEFAEALVKGFNGEVEQ